LHRAPDDLASMASEAVPRLLELSDRGQRIVWRFAKDLDRLCRSRNDRRDERIVVRSLGHAEQLAPLKPVVVPAGGCPSTNDRVEQVLAQLAAAQVRRGRLVELALRLGVGRDVNGGIETLQLRNAADQLIVDVADQGDGAVSRAAPTRGGGMSKRVSKPIISRWGDHTER